MTTSFNCNLFGQDSLCFNGGVCAPEGNYCVCPDGWEADNLLYHAANCAVPNGLYLGMGITFLIVWVAQIIFVVYRGMGLKRGNPLLKVWFIAIVNLISQAVLMAGAVFQRGLFEVSGTGYIFYISTCMLIVQHVLVLLFTFKHGMFKARIQQFELKVRYVTYTAIFFVVVTGICLVTFTHDPTGNDASFSAMLFVFGIWNVFIVSQAVRMANDLAGQLPTDDTVIRPNLVRLKYFWIWFASTVLTLSIFLVLLRYTIGTVPYLWACVYLSGAFVAAPSAAIGAVFFFPKKGSGSSSKKSSNNASSHGIVAAPNSSSAHMSSPVRTHIMTAKSGREVSGSGGPN